MINAVYMIDMIAIIGVDRLFAGKKPIGGPIGARIGRIGRYVHEIVHVPAYVRTDQVNFYACTCTHMHKMDLPIAPNKRHARYFMDIISSTIFHRHR
jgi:hypothetical protein